MTLGTTLAEIALALPIGLRHRCDGAHYLLGSSAEARRLSRKGSVSELRQRFGRSTITKAIAYCLDNHLSNTDNTLKPEHLGSHSENTILPIEAYHRAVQNQYSSPAGKRLQDERRAHCFDRNPEK